MLLIILIGVVGQGILGRDPQIGAMGWFAAYILLAAVFLGGSIVVGILALAWRWIREADR